MDEFNKSTTSSRVTRSRRASNESPGPVPITSAKRTRSRKLKEIDENETESVGDRTKVDDFDDAASSASSSSIKSCKVVLRREKFKDIDANAHAMTQNPRSIDRNKSQLTEENLAAHTRSAPTRRLHSGSFASDGTASTEISRTRSTRLAQLQKTPKKENATRSTIPARRSSRLLSENEKAADSPIRATPARRTLRSNSVVSDDVSPPTTRRTSSRLADSQIVTPKSLKTVVSKIKEPTTPRRLSMRINKSIMATDIIDEESSDEDVDVKMAGESKPTLIVQSTVGSFEPIEVSDLVETPTKMDEKAELTSPKSPSKATPNEIKTPESCEKTHQEDVDMDQGVCVDNQKIEQTSGDTENSKSETPKLHLSARNSSFGPLSVSLSEEINKIVSGLETPVAYKKVERRFNEIVESMASDENQVDVQFEKIAANLTPERADGNKEVVSETSNESQNDTMINETVVNETQPEMESTTLDIEPEQSTDEPDQPSMEQVSQVVTVSSPMNERKSVSSTFECFDRMEVSNLVETTVEDDEEAKLISTNSPSTPKRMETTESSKKTPQMDIDMDQSEHVENEKNEQTFGDIENAKSETPKEHRPSENSSFGSLSMSLKEEINELVAGLETTVANKEVERRSNEIIEIIASDRNQVDVHFEEIAAQLTPKKTGENKEVVSETLNEAQQDESRNNTVINESVVNETQPEMESTTLDIETEQSTDELEHSADEPKQSAIEQVSQSVTASSSKNEQKSVQILTPKMDKNPTAQKRIDTPYPDEKSIHEASENHSKSEEKKKRNRDEQQALARETLKKLQDSWNKSIKRSSLSNDSTNPIDTLNITNSSKVETESPKVAVVARNNWGISNGIVDSDSEDDVDFIPDTEEGSDGESQEDEDEDEHEEQNEFIDDEVEVIEDYQSGDSMDEEERREIEENQIDCGFDLGSDDTDNEEEEDAYEDDGFIVDDDHLTDASKSGNEIDELEDKMTEEDEVDEEIGMKKPKRRLSRIIQVSSSDESEIESLSSASTMAVSATVEQVESVVVIQSNPQKAAEIAEGKKYATTYILLEDEKSSTKTDDGVKSSETNDTLNVTEVDNELVDTDKAAITAKNQTPTATMSTVSEVAQNDANEASISESNDMVESSEQEQVEENETLQQTAWSPVVQIDGKENQTAKKKISVIHRTSLPGIDRLSKPPMVKKANRVSLGDLNPNADPTVAQLYIQTSKINTIKKKDKQVKKNIEKSQVIIDEQEISSSASTKSNGMQNYSFNVSIQEENNNQKPSDEAKLIEQTKIVENVPVCMPIEESQTEDVSAVTSTSENEASTSNANKNKLKRKFIEIDADEEPYERPKSKKVLGIINSASGQFLVEPMTPEKKNKFGFKEVPRTPINRDFKIQKRVQLAIANKRKSMYLNEDDLDLLLPRPNWQINTQFDHEQSKKRARKLDLGSTEIIFQPLESKKKSKKGYSIPVELLQYRKNMLFRAGIQRQDARELIRERQKRNLRK